MKAADAADGDSVSTMPRDKWSAALPACIDSRLEVLVSVGRGRSPARTSLYYRRQASNQARSIQSIQRSKPRRSAAPIIRRRRPQGSRSSPPATSRSPPMRGVNGRRLSSRARLRRCRNDLFGMPMTDQSRINIIDGRPTVQQKHCHCRSARWQAMT